MELARGHYASSRRLAKTLQVPGNTLYLLGSNGWHTGIDDQLIQLPPAGNAPMLRGGLNHTSTRG